MTGSGGVFRLKYKYSLALELGPNYPDSWHGIPSLTVFVFVVEIINSMRPSLF